MEGTGALAFFIAGLQLAAGGGPLGIDATSDLLADLA
jgi:hypothetical protein